MTDLKRACAINLQEKAMLGSTFMCELLKLRVAGLILEEVKGYSNDKVILGTEIQRYFNVHFTKAKVEFMREYPAKEIDWAEYTDNTRHIMSSWRTKNLPVPETINRYAAHVEEQLQNQKEVITPKAVGEEYESFMSSAENIGSKSKLKKRRNNSKNARKVQRSFQNLPQWTYPGTSHVDRWNPPPPPALPSQFYPFPNSTLNVPNYGNRRNIKNARYPQQQTRTPPQDYHPPRRGVNDKRSSFQRTQIQAPTNATPLQPTSSFPNLQQPSSPSTSTSSGYLNKKNGIANKNKNIFATSLD
jgi:hypothetical protein